MGHDMTQHDHPSTAAAGAALPAEGFVRMAQLVGDPNAQPPIPPIVPVSRGHLLRMVKAGTFPPPIKVSKRLAMWPVGLVRQWLAQPTL